MNRKIVTLLCSACLAPLASAQSYAPWWKAVDEADRKDLPKTALRTLHKIRTEALRTGNTAQLLRALFTEQVMQQEIAPDSGRVMIDVIERQMEREKSAVARALWQNALGRLYAARAQRDWRGTDTAAVRKAHDLLLASVQETALTGNHRATEYAPVFELGKASAKVYGDDLLSVLTDALIEHGNEHRGDTPVISRKELRAVLERNLAFYRGQGRKAAALRTEWALADLEDESARVAMLRDIYRRYTDLPENAGTIERLHGLLDEDEEVALLEVGVRRYGKAAATLHNVLLELRRPTATVRWKSDALRTAGNAFYPGVEYRATIEHRNLNEVRLRFVRLKGVDASLKALRPYGIDPDRYIGSEELARMLRKAPHETALTLRKQFSAAPAHKLLTDSIAFTMPESGVYVVELWADGLLKDRELAFVTRGTALHLDGVSAKGELQQDTYVDVITGREITDAREIAFVPDESRRTDYRLRLRDEADSATHMGCELYMDRSIYRPGQKVRFSALMYARKGDDYRVIPNKKGRVEIRDSKDEMLASVPFTTDRFGVASVEYKLPKYCRTGYFSLYVPKDDGTQTIHSFRVEEYVRPKFEVKVDSISERLTSRDSVTVKGRALTFNGVPVRNARVKWSWALRPVWYGSLRHTEDEHLRGTGEALTDDEGRFAFGVRMAADSTLYYRLTARAEVTAPDGETREGLRAVFVNTGHDEPKAEPAMLTAKEEGDHAVFNFGEEATAVYRLVSTAGGLLESKTLEVKAGDSIRVAWRPEYGDGAMASVAYMKGGVYRHEMADVKRPAPEKRLLLRWHTFRPALAPGQSETWTLSVTHPDGRPAAANVTARLYDASLDALGKNYGARNEKKSPWAFRYDFRRALPNLYYRRYEWSAPNPNAYFDVKGVLDVPRFEFTQWQPSMFDYYGRNRIQIAAMDYAAAANEQRAGGVLMSAAAAPRALGETRMMKEAVVAHDANTPGGSVRSNFAETAFFLPTLHTDAKGVATLSFTLPESLTQWQFNAFAHDTELNSGTLDARIVARKELTAEVNAPRCLRAGDEMSWPVKVQNLTRSAARGKAVLTLADARTKRILQTFDTKFALDGDSVLTKAFAARVPEGVDTLLVRVEAKSAKFADGEEHLIPVLSRQVEITRAVPFTVRRGENVQQKETEARRALTAMLERGVNPTIAVDTCRDARAEVAKTVPTWLRVSEGSAYDRAVAFYGIQLAGRLRNYLSLTDYELNAYRATAGDRLAELQNADGSWSWFKGMGASPYITAQIAVLLTRSNMLADNRAYVYVRDRALKYLDGAADSLVAEMKRQEAKYRTRSMSLPEWAYSYLYVRRLRRLDETPTTKYLLRVYARQNKDLSLYGKSGQAVVLSGTDYDGVARTALESVIEHTVLSEEMGRYFDARRALGGRASYRIPTQTFAIEALQRSEERMPKVDGVDNGVLVDQMKLWLLQSRRTQAWNSSRATTDAAFALLSQPAGANEGLTWGAVSATYKIDAAQATAGGNGFKLERRLEVKRGEKWTAADKVHTGDRVRWVYTLTADRDYDHVALTSTRPAGLEPNDPFSGTTWQDGVLAYRRVRDAENEYFIEHLPKGVHVFTDESFAVRAGSFDGGLATVRCVFAPEFTATSAPMRLTVVR